MVRRLGRFIFGAVMLAMFLAWARPATAQVCHTLEKQKHGMWGAHKEALGSISLASNGQLMQLFMSRRGETWTLVLVDPQTGCFKPFASGTDWQGITFKAPETPS